MRCDVKKIEGEKHELQLRLTFEDKMDRDLTSELKEGEFQLFYSLCLHFTSFFFSFSFFSDDEARNLAWDLVYNGLASDVSL